MEFQGNFQKIPDNGIEFSFILFLFHQFRIILNIGEFFTFFQSVVPTIKLKGGKLSFLT